ncbi:phosphatase PAP2 family protein [Alteribacillus iranensis]|uniref:Undecaprenyl-diphosphatase n=1 Tax=Alteribacillus iranensis TaxID=930128 RepID=A0A1I1ZNK3_9BACI|nr:phosphatase PAP2 family protein [Alteribacillus iranensis]SFE31940.1 undecaprenyl-diphosphatase [Alteribacillus iranensis]
MDKENENIPWILILWTLGCSTLFFVMLVVADTPFVTQIDYFIASYIPSYQYEWGIAFFSFITSLASVNFTSFMTAFVSALLLLFGKVKQGLLVIATVGGGGLLNYIVKSIYERERPDISRVIEVSGYSFPSGHAMNAMLLYGVLMILFLHFSSANTLLQVAVVLISVFLIVAIGISRIFLGVHYPSDVTAGFLCGGAWLGLMHILLRLYERNKQMIGKAQKM